jgi:hypothetical protein
MRLFAFLLLFASLTSGCAQQVAAPTVLSSKSYAESYKPSTLDASFPVPREASISNKKAKDPHQPYVRYQYTGLTKIKKQRIYFSHLQQVGWQERKNEQLGGMYVFQKGEKKIHMTIHDQFFTLFIPRRSS